ALGPEPDVDVETFTHTARDGDVYLICSDGLSGMVSEEEIAEIIADSASLKEAAQRLVNAANKNGGKDNITVVLFRLESDGEPEPDRGGPGRPGPGGCDLRPLRGQPPVLLPRHGPARGDRAVSRAAVRPAAGHPPLHAGVLERRSRLGDNQPPPAREPPRPPAAQPRRRRHPPARARALGDAPLMRARNRELFGLLPVSLLVT